MSLRVLNIPGPEGGPSLAPRPRNLRLDSSTASARYLPASLSLFRTTRLAPRGWRRRGSALGTGGACRQRPLPAGSPGRRRRSPGVCIGGSVSGALCRLDAEQHHSSSALHTGRGFLSLQACGVDRARSCPGRPIPIFGFHSYCL